MADRRQFADNPFAAPESDIRPEQYEAADTPAAFATFWQRFAASFVDGICVQLLSVALGFGIGIIAAGTGLAKDDGSGSAGSRAFSRSGSTSPSRSRPSGRRPSANG